MTRLKDDGKCRWKVSTESVGKECTVNMKKWRVREDQVTSGDKSGE